MGYLSLLPESLSNLETFLIRVFILLGLLTIAPWTLLLLYDITLYAFRTTWYFTPYIGGRARGLHKPSAPTLDTRPSGRARTFSMISLPERFTPTTSPRKSLKSAALDSSDDDDDDENDCNDYNYEDEDKVNDNGHGRGSGGKKRNDSGQGGLKGRKNRAAIERDPGASPTPNGRRRVSQERTWKGD